MIDYKNTVQVIRFADEGFKSSSVNLNKNRENTKPYVARGCYAFACQVDLFALSGKAFKRQEEDIHVVYFPKDLKVYSWHYSWKENSFLDFGICTEKLFSLGDIEKRIIHRKNEQKINKDVGYEFTEIYIPENIVKNIKQVKKTEDLIDINGKIYTKEVILNKYKYKQHKKENANDKLEKWLERL